MCDVSEIIDRMITAVGAKDQSEMLDICGFSSGAAGNWKSRKKVPEKSIKIVASHGNVRREWIETGEGGMKVMEGKPDFFIEQIAEAAIDYKGKSITLSRDEFILLTLFRKLDEANQEELVDIAALKAEWQDKT